MAGLLDFIGDDAAANSNPYGMTGADRLGLLSQALMGFGGGLSRRRAPGLSLTPGGADPGSSGFGEAAASAAHAYQGGMANLQRQALLRRQLGADQRQAKMDEFKFGEMSRKANAEKELAAAIASGDPARVAAARAAANPEAAYQSQYGWQKPQGQIDQERGETEWKSNLGVRQSQQARVKTPEEIAQDKAAADDAARRSIMVNSASQAASASSPTNDMREYKFAKDNGYTGTFQEFKTGQKANLEQSANQRAAMAQSQGLTPGSPAYQSFVLTGKMPREDQQPLTATDKKAILEADEGVLAANMGIASLKRAKEISAKAFEGPTAGLRGYAASMVGNEGGLATLDLDNEVTTNALSQMKAIFGGNPTEGERKILLDVQGASKLPHAARVKIFDRAILAMEARLKFNQQRADELRGGTFFKPGGEAGGKAGYKSKYGLD